MRFGVRNHRSQTSARNSDDFTIGRHEHRVRRCGEAQKHQFVCLSCILAIGRDRESARRESCAGRPPFDHDR